jgi:hypothetical protein
MTRPAPGLALYPLNGTGTSLSVEIISNATVIALRYVSTATTVVSVSFVGKSTETVAAEINASGLPIRAVVISNTESHSQGDFISTGSGYVSIPQGFGTYDRIVSNGVLLRVKKVVTRHTSASSIFLLPPYSESPGLPWYPRINNGSFTQKYKNKLYHFYISEYDKQTWSPRYGKPFKEVRGVQPALLDKDTYQLPKFPVYWNGQNITIYNKDLAIPNGVISDIDIHNGIIYLKPELNITQEFTIDYTYLENSYVYKEININGHFSNNPLVLEKFVVIYMIPVEGAGMYNKRTVFHAIGDTIPEAIASISVEDPDLPIAVIGAYAVHPVAASDTISLLDTRVKGGGLKDVTGPTSPVHILPYSVESSETPIEDVYQESYRFWDIGHIDGEPYPGAAAVAIDLPEELKDILPISDIQKRATKFLAAGVYPSFRFTDRASPAVTGLSSQLSCTYNENLSDIFEKSSTYTNTGVIASVPSTASGAGWFLDTPSLPRSVFVNSGWYTFNPGPTVLKDSDGYLLEVNTSTGVTLSYLKSTPNTEVRWEERTVAYNTASLDNPIEYSQWVSKKYLDTKECATGHLIKNHLYFAPDNQTKQYRKIKVYSPYHHTNLEAVLYSGISDIIDTTLTLLNSNNELVSGYTTVGDLSAIEQHADYVLTPDEFLNLYNLEYTPLESEYLEDLIAIGKRFTSSGAYGYDHYFKYYSQSTNQYLELTDEAVYYNFNFSNSLRTLNKYLDLGFRYGLWSQECSTGAMVSTGLCHTLISGSLNHGNYGPGLPVFWTYYLDVGMFSGVPLATNESNTETLLSENNDYVYSLGFDYILSSLLSFTGSDLSSTLNRIYDDVYNTVNSDVIQVAAEAVNDVRTLSGYDTTSHWFISQNRVGNYLGNNLYNLIEGYKYLHRYNSHRDYPLDLTSPSAGGADRMLSVFSGIESVLLNSYDVVYNNILRGGITEPEAALTIYGYGWYVNNWNSIYGINSRLYTRDYREKFSGLFTNGLKQLIKNQITDDQLLEIKAVQGSPGPFRAAVPASILYPLGQALELDYDQWKGIAEAVVRTVIDTYSEDGLYYEDPYKVSNSAGRQDAVLGGLTSMYKSVASSGQVDLFEPLHTDLATLRGTKFLPNFTSYDTNPPVAGWAGATNTLSFWKYYHSGDVEDSVSALKNAGVNALAVDLDYMMWRSNPSGFVSNLDHLFRTCYENRIRVVPSLFFTEGTQVAAGQETAYYGYGHTGGSYHSSWLYNVELMSGAGSGEAYVSYIVDRYDNHPALLAWSPYSSGLHHAQAAANCNGVMYIIKENGSSPIIYNTNCPVSNWDIRSITLLEEDVVITDPSTQAQSPYPGASNMSDAPAYSARVSKIAVQVPALSSFFIDNLSVTGNDIILTNYGDGTYGDYELAIDKATNANLPIILSNLFIKSGSRFGCVYNTSDARNVRQMHAVTALAQDHGVDVDSGFSQLRTFGDKYFYHS